MRYIVLLTHPPGGQDLIALTSDDNGIIRVPSHLRVTTTKDDGNSSVIYVQPTLD